MTATAVATEIPTTDTAVEAADCTAAALLPVVGADLTVPLVTGESVRYANLDYAASAPALRTVADHIATALPYYASVHRGAGYASQVSTALLENARACVARFLDARPDDVAIFTRNTTDALNLLAGAVPEGGSVLYLDLEHHANLLPWQRRGDVVLEAGPTLRETLADLDAALKATPTALVAVTGASNVTGELLPIRKIARLAHRHGARIVVDAAQLAPHRRISLTRTGVDYLALSGHKLYAPYGAGVLIGRRDWLDAAPAYLAGGGAVREVTASAGTEWAPAPARHEGGTPNVLGAAALAKACETLAELELGPGAEALREHEEALRRRLLAGLARHPQIEVLRIWPDSAESIGVVAFTVAGQDSGLVAAILSAEYGVGLRDGRFCAHPLAARLGLERSGALRASFGVGSCAADVDRLLGALDRLLAEGPGWAYELVDGRYAPVGDPRRLPDFAGPNVTAGSPCQQ
ncbi:MAG TPA: aminotransferase class V-fold PLP-dependent enzyme [Actinocrinis sp.]|nr:aminotransferase class V-fold PLP-dependent enzyme [Actinocrinis sp.]